MKRNEIKEEQKNQVQQKDQQPIIRVHSGLRAGTVATLLRGCVGDI
jgi:hypothetical protein